MLRDTISKSSDFLWRDRFDVTTVASKPSPRPPSNGNKTAISQAMITICSQVAGLAAADMQYVARKQMKLSLEAIILDTERKSFTDQRRTVHYIVAEYRGTDGETYRKLFENLKGLRVEVPKQGTHAELNAAKIQWRD